MAPTTSNVTIIGYAVHYIINDGTVVMDTTEMVVDTKWSITLNEDQDYDIEITVRSLSQSLLSTEVTVDIPDCKTS